MSASKPWTVQIPLKGEHKRSTHRLLDHFFILKFIFHIFKIHLHSFHSPFFSVNPYFKHVKSETPQVFHHITRQVLLILLNKCCTNTSVRHWSGYCQSKKKKHGGWRTAKKGLLRTRADRGLVSLHSGQQKKRPCLISDFKHPLLGFFCFFHRISKQNKALPGTSTGERCWKSDGSQNHQL